jgi:hypothetical protein
MIFLLNKLILQDTLYLTKEIKQLTKSLCLNPALSSHVSIYKITINLAGVELCSGKRAVGIIKHPEFSNLTYAGLINRIVIFECQEIIVLIDLHK